MDGDSVFLAGGPRRQVSTPGNNSSGPESQGVFQSRIPMQGLHPEKGRFTTGLGDIVKGGDILGSNLGDITLRDVPTTATQATRATVPLPTLPGRGRNISYARQPLGLTFMPKNLAVEATAGMAQVDDTMKVSLVCGPAGGLGSGVGKTTGFSTSQQANDSFPGARAPIPEFEVVSPTSSVGSSTFARNHPGAQGVPCHPISCASVQEAANSQQINYMMPRCDNVTTFHGIPQTTDRPLQPTLLAISGPCVEEGVFFGNVCQFPNHLSSSSATPRTAARRAKRDSMPLSEMLFGEGLLEDEELQPVHVIERQNQVQVICRSGTVEAFQTPVNQVARGTNNSTRSKKRQSMALLEDFKDPKAESLLDEEDFISAKPQELAVPCISFEDLPPVDLSFIEKKTLPSGTVSTSSIDGSVQTMNSAPEGGSRQVHSLPTSEAASKEHNREASDSTKSNMRPTDGISMQGGKDREADGGSILQQDAAPEEGARIQTKHAFNCKTLDLMPKGAQPSISTSAGGGSPGLSEGKDHWSTFLTKSIEFNPPNFPRVLGAYEPDLAKPHSSRSMELPAAATPKEPKTRIMLTKSVDSPATRIPLKPTTPVSGTHIGKGPAASTLTCIGPSQKVNQASLKSFSMSPAHKTPRQAVASTRKPLDPQSEKDVHGVRSWTGSKLRPLPPLAAHVDAKPQDSTILDALDSKACKYPTECSGDARDVLSDVSAEVNKAEVRQSQDNKFPDHDQCPPHVQLLQHVTADSTIKVGRSLSSAFDQVRTNGTLCLPTQAAQHTKAHALGVVTSATGPTDVLDQDNASKYEEVAGKSDRGAVGLESSPSGEWKGEGELGNPCLDLQQAHLGGTLNLHQEGHGATASADNLPTAAELSVIMKGAKTAVPASNGEAEPQQSLCTMDAAVEGNSEGGAGLFMPTDAAEEEAKALPDVCVQEAQEKGKSQAPASHAPSRQPSCQEDVHQLMGHLSGGQDQWGPDKEEQQQVVVDTSLVKEAHGGVVELPEANVNVGDSGPNIFPEVRVVEQSSSDIPADALSHSEQIAEHVATGGAGDIAELQEARGDRARDTDLSGLGKEKDGADWKEGAGFPLGTASGGPGAVSNESGSSSQESDTQIGVPFLPAHPNLQISEAEGFRGQEGNVEMPMAALVADSDTELDQSLRSTGDCAWNTVAPESASTNRDAAALLKNSAATEVPGNCDRGQASAVLIHQGTNIHVQCPLGNSRSVKTPAKVGCTAVQEAAADDSITRQIEERLEEPTECGPCQGKGGTQREASGFTLMPGPLNTGKADPSRVQVEGEKTAQLDVQPVSQDSTGSEDHLGQQCPPKEASEPESEPPALTNKDSGLQSQLCALPHDQESHEEDQVGRMRKARRTVELATAETGKEESHGKAEALQLPILGKATSPEIKVNVPSQTSASLPKAAATSQAANSKPMFSLGRSSPPNPGQHRLVKGKAMPSKSTSLGRTRAHSESNRPVPGGAVAGSAKVNANSQVPHPRNSADTRVQPFGLSLSRSTSGSEPFQFRSEPALQEGKHLRHSAAPRMSGPAGKPGNQGSSWGRGSTRGSAFGPGKKGNAQGQASASGIPLPAGPRRNNSGTSVASSGSHEDALSARSSTSSSGSSLAGDRKLGGRTGSLSEKIQRQPQQNSTQRDDTRPSQVTKPSAAAPRPPAKAQPSAFGSGRGPSNAPPSRIPGVQKSVIPKEKVPQFGGAATTALGKRPSSDQGKPPIPGVLRPPTGIRIVAQGHVASRGASAAPTALPKAAVSQQAASSRVSTSVPKAGTAGTRLASQPARKGPATVKASVNAPLSQATKDRGIATSDSGVTRQSKDIAPRPPSISTAHSAALPSNKPKADTAESCNVVVTSMTDSPLHSSGPSRISKFPETLDSQVHMPGCPAPPVTSAGLGLMEEQAAVGPLSRECSDNTGSTPATPFFTPVASPDVVGAMIPAEHHKMLEMKLDRYADRKPDWSDEGSDKFHEANTNSGTADLPHDTASSLTLGDAAALGTSERTQQKGSQGQGSDKGLPHLAKLKAGQKSKGRPQASTGPTPEASSASTEIFLRNLEAAAAQDEKEVFLHKGGPVPNSPLMRQPSSAFSPVHRTGMIGPFDCTKRL